MENLLHDYGLLLGVAAGALLFILLIVWLWPKKEKEPPALPKEKISIPMPESKPLEKEPVVPDEVEPAPLPKKKTFSKAIASWVPLLEQKTKDRDRWEEVLMTSDMGPQLADQLLEGLQQTEQEPIQFLKSELKKVLGPAKATQEPWAQYSPWVLFIVGVNGVGKTTSIVKLGHYFKSSLNKSVAVIGADTFRKAAIEQLQRGCERCDIEFYSQKQSSEQSEGADPSSVVFDGLKKFADHEVILVDTSGRLHTKKNLMEELKKMKRVADKSLPGAPHDLWLVLDATLGQNAVVQAKEFDDAVGLSGLMLTKMDGLSRGGSVFQLFRQLQKPIWFIGKGEKPEDIESFDPEQFVEDLFDLRVG